MAADRNALIPSFPLLVMDATELRPRKDSAALSKLVPQRITGTVVDLIVVPELRVHAPVTDLTRRQRRLDRALPVPARSTVLVHGRTSVALWRRSSNEICSMAYSAVRFPAYVRSTILRISDRTAAASLIGST